MAPEPEAAPLDRWAWAEELVWHRKPGKDAITSVPGRMDEHPDEMGTTVSSRSCTATSGMTKTLLALSIPPPLGDGAAPAPSRTRSAGQGAPPTMLATDLAAGVNSIYERTSLEHPEELATEFAAPAALIHRDMGPVVRYLGPLVSSRPSCGRIRSPCGQPMTSSAKPSRCQP